MADFDLVYYQLGLILCSAAASDVIGVGKIIQHCIYRLFHQFALLEDYFGLLSNQIFWQTKFLPDCLFDTFIPLLVYSLFDLTLSFEAV